MLKEHACTCRGMLLQGHECVPAAQCMQSRLEAVGLLRDNLARADPRQPCAGAQKRVLLASTKAAGMGLNLVCASKVIVLDVWWNGAFED